MLLGFCYHSPMATALSEGTTTDLLDLCTMTSHLSLFEALLCHGFYNYVLPLSFLFLRPSLALRLLIVLLFGVSYIPSFSSFGPVVCGPSVNPTLRATTMTSLQMIPNHRLQPWTLHIHILSDQLDSSIQVSQEALQTQNQCMNMILLWCLPWWKGSP